MNYFSFVQIFVGFVIIGLSQSTPINNRLAVPCDTTSCVLPDCQCSSTTIPGGLTLEEVPQLVMLTFDDDINTINMEYYRQSLFNRVNPNNCSIQATYYISHEYTDYSLVS